MKHNCEELMLSCFKNLQYFDKGQWRKLDGFVAEEVGRGKKHADQLQVLKQNVEEKDILIKKLIKENMELKN